MAHVGPYQLSKELARVAKEEAEKLYYERMFACFFGRFDYEIDYTRDGVRIPAGAREFVIVSFDLGDGSNERSMAIRCPTTQGYELKFIHLGRESGDPLMRLAIQARNCNKLFSLMESYL